MSSVDGVDLVQKEGITDHQSAEISKEPEFHPPPQQQLKKKKFSWQNIRRIDSLDVESHKFRRGSNDLPGSKNGGSWGVILNLAFQSIGVVYGDIGTSPLYVFSSTFANGISHNDDILAVLSLILYTITLIPLIKYVFIVLQANDNGEGGTFAMYSLISRHVKVGLIPSQESADEDVSTFNHQLENQRRLKRASMFKSRLENSNFAKFVLLLTAMLGTSMVIGDGILTPSISVLSAVGGIKEATSAMTEGRIVWISVAILDHRENRQCIWYGYTDARNDGEPFETLLVKKLCEFIREDYLKFSNDVEEEEDNVVDGSSIGERVDGQEAERDIELVEKASEAGIVHFVGEHEVVARNGASLGKRILIDYGYNFLTRNLRQSNEVFNIPQKRMLKVGMTYEL
ncbi:OLC1v1036976C1 [Oldenlandia corymbosa var. corymbosa]|uniref:OLC1v1036976C1 n=1 Tax=Oldenlandia corymbosa var. corymbosa TaxID=529605 RepID=A0AAV1CWH3_OLDCO|nr:OLC1v1036976C1 [Oldenlandia corymbosa var. corymbosa]